MICKENNYNKLSVEQIKGSNSTQKTQGTTNKIKDV